MDKPTTPFDALLSRISGQSAETTWAVIDEYTRRLIGVASKRLPKCLEAKDGAGDAVQSAFRTVIRRVNDGKLNPDSLDELWRLLVAITACKVNRRIRKYLTDKRDVRREMGLAGMPGEEDAARVYDPAAPGATAEETTALEETIEWVRRELKDPVADQILTMRLQGYSPGEIAAAVGRAEETVFRVLRKIKAALTDRIHRDSDSREEACGPRSRDGARR